MDQRGGLGGGSPGLSLPDTEADLVKEAEAKAEREAFSCSCRFMLTAQTLEGFNLGLPDFAALFFPSPG